ncbi:MAG: type I 3-dehydroquinate dehydratase, partial [Candidatus Hydrothermarchaeaceae archaeon]
MRLNTPSICASVIAHSVEEFLATLNKIEHADIIEIRADGLKLKNNGHVSPIRALLKEAKGANLPIILTVRMSKEGGSFSGTEAQRIECIKEGIKYADMLDIELGMAGEDRDELISIAKSKKVPVILSYHDFKNTPGEDKMMAILKEEEKLGASVSKLAVTANSEADVLRLLGVTKEAKKLLKIPFCTISLGKIGAISRIAAPVF